MTERKIKVQATHLTKEYDLANKDPFWALCGVDFTAYEGETIAVVGTNGSGKSTLMKILAGATAPTSGILTLNGTPSLIAINAGLRNGLSGRDNIWLKGMMSGLTEAQLAERMDDIIEFSELDAFIDQPVKSYSSGMKSKLGFAISVYTDPDILIVDEALSVGDAAFNRKSLQKIKDFQEAGKTIFFVSHSLKQVRQMADRVLWLEYGFCREFGPTQPVMDAYDAEIARYEALDPDEQAEAVAEARKEQIEFDLSWYAAKQRHEPKGSFTVHRPKEVDAGTWLILGTLVGLTISLAYYFIMRGGG